MTEPNGNTPAVQKPEEQVSQKPLLQVQFDDERSIMFHYARQGINPFQLMVLAETFRIIAELEIAEWHKKTTKVPTPSILVPSLAIKH